MSRMPKINPVGRRSYFLLKVLGFLGILFSIFALAVILNIDWLREVVDDRIFANKHHYLSCDELPTSEEVARVFSEHQETVYKIEQVNPGFVTVAIDPGTCPSSSDIVITYPSRRNMVEIKKIINGDTFFGIPYRLINI